LELIASVERVSGRKVPHHLGPRRAGDPPALVADPGLAARLLGWRAAHSDMDTIVRTALAWHEGHRA
jgi:UDP-glucose 4-epimerase